MVSPKVSIFLSRLTNDAIFTTLTHVAHIYVHYLQIWDTPLKDREAFGYSAHVSVALQISTKFGGHAIFSIASDSLPGMDFLMSGRGPERKSTFRHAVATNCDEHVGLRGALVPLPSYGTRIPNVEVGSVESRWMRPVRNIPKGTVSHLSE